MASIVILGAGVMGSALAVPACDNGHDVTLVGSPLDDDVIAALRRDRHHPKLRVTLPGRLAAVTLDELDDAALATADAVVIAVSSAGVDWALDALTDRAADLGTLGLITKGLVPRDSGPPLTYATSVPARLAAANVACTGFVGIGGPCIAREIACRVPTVAVHACTDIDVARRFGSLFGTPAYRVELSDDTVGVEACAALKNFLAIGVASTIGRHAADGPGSSEHAQPAKNPTAAAFTRALRELDVLSSWLGGRPGTAFDLAGAGDLHVTVGGGRNSRLGVHLGEGMTVDEALAGPLAGETVEGRDTGLALAPALRRAMADGSLAGALPLTLALVDALEGDGTFELDFSRLGGPG